MDTKRALLFAVILCFSPLATASSRIEAAIKRVTYEFEPGGRVLLEVDKGRLVEVRLTVGAGEWVRAGDRLSRVRGVSLQGIEVFVEPDPDSQYLVWTMLIPATEVEERSVNEHKLLLEFSEIGLRKFLLVDGHNESEVIADLEEK